MAAIVASARGKAVGQGNPALGQGRRRAPAAGKSTGPKPRFPQNISDQPSTWEVFTLMSWRDRRMAALSQAGLVEKFVDALIWVFYPVFFYRQGMSLAQIGWMVGVYGFVWGGSQLFTGKLSDHIGRQKPIVWGMWLCGAGVGMTLLGSGVAWWSFSAAVTGFGMALLYPNLSAAVADIAHPNWRGSAIGIYRFWRDTGYGIGALLLGGVAHVSGNMNAGFWFVTGAMFLSGLIVWLWGEENPSPAQPGRSVGAGRTLFPAKEASMKLGIVISSNDPETVWNAFRLGGFALGQGDAVHVFLLGKGVECESLDTEHFAVTQAMQELADRGGKIDACGTCLKLRNAEAGGVCALSTLQDLYRLTCDCDRVLTF